MFQKILACKGRLNKVLVMGQQLHPAMVKYLADINDIQANPLCLTDVTWASSNHKNLKAIERMYGNKFKGFNQSPKKNVD